MAATTYPIRSSEKLAQAFLVVLRISAVVAVIALAAGFNELTLLSRQLQGAYVTESATFWSDMTQGLVGLAQFITAIGATVLLITYVWRAYTNVHAFAPTPAPSHRRWMAAWGFFIPIVALFYPFRIVREIYRGHAAKASGSFQGWDKLPIPSLLVWWWTAYLFDNILSNLAGRMAISDLIAGGDTKIERLVATSQMYLASDFVSLLAIFATYLVIQELARVEKSALAAPAAVPTPVAA